MQKVDLKSKFVKAVFIFSFVILGNGTSYADSTSADVPVNLTIMPKEEQEPIIEVVKEVQTGDDIILWPGALVAILAFTLMIILVRYSRKRKEK